MAALAPRSVSDLIFSALREITVTSWPALNNFSVNGLEILPAPPVIAYYI